MNIIASRLPAIKFLATFGALNLGYTVLAKQFGQNVMSIDDYLTLVIEQNTNYTIAGVIKPRSIRLIQGLNKKFVLTDSVNELKCKFAGITTVEVKEGDTAIITGYCPDPNNRQNMIVKQYVTKHSMETNEWKPKTNVSNKSYGLEKYQ